MAAPTTFSDTDMQGISGRTQALMRDVGSVSGARAANQIDAAAADAEQRSMVRDARDAMRAEYELSRGMQRNVDMLAQMNEAWNANSYIVDSLTSEKRRVGALDALTRRDLYRARQQHLHGRFSTRSYTVATNSVVATLAVVMLLLLPFALWGLERLKLWAAVAWAVLLLVVYLGVALAISRNAAMRWTTAYDKYYFRDPRTKKDGDDGSC